MIMSLFVQIGLLFWKNLIVMWRSKLWLVAEILFSLFLLPYIIVVVRYAPAPSKEDAYSFEPFFIAGNSSDIERKINNSASIDTYYNCHHDLYLGYSYEAGLANLSNSLMAKIREHYSDNLTMQIEIQNFSTAKQMVKELENDLNQTREEMCGQFLGGVHFTNIRLRERNSEPHLIYRIFLPKRNMKWQLIDSFWLDDDPNGPQSDHNQIPSEPPYWQSGFLSIQYAIETTFLEMNNVESGIKGFSLDNSIFSFLRIPIDQSSSGSMILFLKYMYILWLVALMGIMLHTAKNIVLEKEAGIKTYMSVMGLQPMAFYYSHIIIGFFKATLVMILCTNILCKGLHFTSPTVFIFFSVIFGLAMVILSALISAIVKKPQLTQFMANLVPALLLVLTIVTTPSISKIDLCLLASLNPVTAFKLGIAQIINSETKMIELGWNSIFNGFTTQFTIGLAMLMLIFDCVLYSLLICYFDLVLPTDETPKKHPLFFLECFDSIFTRNNFDYTGEDEMDSNAINENMEQEHGNLEEADIIVNHMSKNWGGGNLAVDNLNFRAYKGQLTVLLGHNGAGKTTTFSVLTGSIDSSAGQVFICKKDLKSNLHDCQKNMGYCPQNNPLFDKLNVREHLKLYAGLKTGYFCGPFGRRALDQEINQIIKNVGLEEKINTEAQNLSGGQKRKLCVAISLVAGSRVVLLDEPTAGMDPEARNEIGKLLAQAKKERTILMTTHYMEEADLLGDRIGIMVNGRLVCNGSPEFLKNKYSAGYILSFVCAGFDFAQNETSSDNLRLFNQTINRILGVVRKYSPNARVEKAQRPPEFAIILPVSDKKHYANLFEELENGKILLGISSFGLSLNTLEQVFLRVGELAEPEVTDQVDGSSAEQLAKDLFSARQQQLFFCQLAALFYRHLLWTCRNPMRSLLPLAIAIFSFIFLGLIIKPSSPLLRQNRSLSLDDAHEKMRIPIQIRGNSAEKLQEQFKKLSELFCSNCLLTINPKKDLHDELKKELINFPPMVAGVAIYENISTGKLEIEALFNGIAVHSPPMALSFITNALLGAKKFSIRPSIEIYDVPSNGTIDDEAFIKVAADFINNAMVSGVIIMCFSIFGATMVVPLVEEKSGKFKHQLMLTKLHIITYWVSVFLWNLVFYVIFCAILAIFFLYFGWMKDYMADLCLLWALYFWSYVPMNAVISFIFDKPQRAFTAVLSWSMVASIFFLMASTSLAYVFNLRKMAEVMDTFLYILTPVYALGSGILKIFLHSFALSLDNYDDWYLKKHFELMLLSGIFFWTILTILQSRMLATKFHQLSCQIFHRRLYQRILDLDEDVAQEDQDIRNERERLDTQESRMFALTVRNLSKYYGRLPAVRNLTFGVKQKECFGLLGVNGAGKTTTFDILTGVRFATSGSATVGGINVNKAPAIGYCPQFDALPMELTGREVLTLLAHLNDFSDIKIRVNQIIWSIRMEKHADKKIINYSGGQRRRISIGITLVTRSSLIMLDEPTAGIDPKTRRQIWQLLQAIRQQGIAILLTSHSMDECEELCNKIGFLNRGRLVGIGSSQHLKSRFGNSYLLTITVANPTPAVLAHLNKHVVEKFKALPTEDLPTSRTFHWQVPKQENVTWSWLYRMAQKLADLYPDHPHLLPLDNDRPKIVDFSLTQNSLEQVFMRLSKGLPD